jgi:hypothetical protein
LLPRQQTTNYIIQIAKKKKNTQLQKGLQTSDGEEHWSSRIYARCVTILYGNCPVSRVITTRKLYKSWRNIQYLDTLIELKRFERCAGTQVQFVLEKKKKKDSKHESR